MGINVSKQPTASISRIKVVAAGYIPEDPNLQINFYENLIIGSV
jgi:hypothetical protein